MIYLQLQVEIERQQEQLRKVAKTREQLADFFPEDGSPILKKDVVEAMMKRNGIKAAMCYRNINNAIAQGVIEELGGHQLALKPDNEN